MTFRWIVAALAAGLALVACGGGTDRTKAQVRLVNASGYTALDLRVEDETRQGGVTYGNTSGYVEVAPGKASTVIASAGSPTALLSFTPGISAKKYYTLLAYGNQGALKQAQLDENAGAPDNNRALLRVINAAPDAGALDVYLTSTEDTLASSVAVQSGAALGTVGGWITVNSTTWRLRVTAAGSKTDLRLDLASLVLSSKQVATLVLTPSSGGVLVNALLLNQQGEVAARDGAQARVRAVAGVGGGGTVSARLASSSLLAGVAAPAVGAYSLVPAGNQSVVVSVDGASLPSELLSLAPGADYTLLVYGAAGSPAFKLIPDDNHLPVDSTRPRLRLVHGVASLTGKLAMTIDFNPAAAEVALGEASGYTEAIAATSKGKLSVTAAGQSTPLFTAVDQTFAAGSTYSIFMVGATTDSGGPVGIVRTDR